MPLVAWCAIAYAAGLLAGFALTERDALLAAAMLAALSVGAMRFLRVRIIGGVIAIAAGGVLVAMADAAHERACGVALAARREWELSVEQSVGEGDVARGAISASGCRRRATVFVDSGRGAPGEALLLTGRAQPGEPAMIVQAGRLRALGRGALLPRLR